MTSYDEIWTTFLTKCKVGIIDLPKTDDKIYDAIHSAILDYNNRLQTDLTWDDNTETVSELLEGDYLLLLARFLRLNFLVNQETFSASSWQPFGGDIGRRSLKDQLSTLRKLVEDENKVIDRILINLTDDY